MDIAIKCLPDRLGIFEGKAINTYPKSLVQLTRRYTILKEQWYHLSKECHSLSEQLGDELHWNQLFVSLCTQAERCFADFEKFSSAKQRDGNTYPANKVNNTNKANKATSLRYLTRTIQLLSTMVKFKVVKNPRLIRQKDQLQDKMNHIEQSNNSGYYIMFGQRTSKSMIRKISSPTTPSTKYCLFPLPKTSSKADQISYRTHSIRRFRRRSIRNVSGSSDNTNITSTTEDTCVTSPLHPSSNSASPSRSEEVSFSNPSVSFSSLGVKTTNGTKLTIPSNSQSPKQKRRDTPDISLYQSFTPSKSQIHGKRSSHSSNSGTVDVAANITSAPPTPPYNSVEDSHTSQSCNPSSIPQMGMDFATKDKYFPSQNSPQSQLVYNNAQAAAGFITYNPITYKDARDIHELPLNSSQSYGSNTSVSNFIESPNNLSPFMSRNRIGSGLETSRLSTISGHSETSLLSAVLGSPELVASVPQRETFSSSVGNLKHPQGSITHVISQNNDFPSLTDSQSGGPRDYTHPMSITSEKNGPSLVNFDSEISNRHTLDPRIVGYTSLNASPSPSFSSIRGNFKRTPECALLPELEVSKEARGQNQNSIGDISLKNNRFLKTYQISSSEPPTRIHSSNRHIRDNIMLQSNIMKNGENSFLEKSKSPNFANGVHTDPLSFSQSRQGPRSASAFDIRSNVEDGFLSTQNDVTPASTNSFSLSPGPSHSSSSSVSQMSNGSPYHVTIAGTLPFSSGRINASSYPVRPGGYPKSLVSSNPGAYERLNSSKEPNSANKKLNAGFSNEGESKQYNVGFFARLSQTFDPETEFHIPSSSTNRNGGQNENIRPNGFIMSMENDNTPEFKDRNNSFSHIQNGSEDKWCQNLRSTLQKHQAYDESAKIQEREAASGSMDNYLDEDTEEINSFSKYKIMPSNLIIHNSSVDDNKDSNIPREGNNQNNTKTYEEEQSRYVLDTTLDYQLKNNNVSYGSIPKNHRMSASDGSYYGTDSGEVSGDGSSFEREPESNRSQSQLSSMSRSSSLKSFRSNFSFSLLANTFGGKKPTMAVSTASGDSGSGHNNSSQYLDNGTSNSSNSSNSNRNSYMEISNKPHVYEDGIVPSPTTPTVFLSNCLTEVRTNKVTSFTR